MSPKRFMAHRSPIRPFSALLQVLLDRRPAGVVDWADRFGITQGQMSNLLAGRRKPPRNGLERMLDVMDKHRLPVSDAEKQEFLLAGYLEHAPIWLAIHLRNLHLEIDGLAADVERLSRLVSDRGPEGSPPAQR
jgi:hypothetical protein